MSTRDALIEEIKKQPEPVLIEVQQFLNSLISESDVQTVIDGGKDAMGYPIGYFERTAGAFANEPFERDPEPPMEQREKW